MSSPHLTKQDRPPPPEIVRSRAATHLGNASSFLDGKRWREAEVEILRALDLVPHETRALRLLALVRFKLGRLDEAEVVCRELVETEPDDPALRLKLGLIALKLDRAADAVRELEIAVRLVPDDQRAWTYLGFAYARLGDSARAVDAFHRGGQESLAAELELPASARKDAKDAKEASEGKDASELQPSGDSGLSSSAELAGGDAFEEPPSFAAAVSPALAAAVLGEGRLVEPEDSLDALDGPGSVSISVAPAREPDTGSVSLPVPPSSPVLSLLSFTLSRLGALDRMANHQMGAALRLDFAREVHVRAAAVVAVSGRATSSWARRREQGRKTEALLGEGADAFLCFEGDGDVVLAEPRGVPVTLALDDDILYLRLPRLLAFDADVLWEAGRIPRTQLDMVQFRGDGRVVMALVGHPTALKVTPSQPVAIAARSLVGWAGRIVARGIVPAGLPGAAAQAAPLILHCEGEGVVLADLFPPS